MSLPEHVHKFTVEHHQSIKPLILKQIDKAVELNRIKSNDRGFLYDHDLAQSPKPYIKLVERTLYPFYLEIGSRYGLKLFGDRYYWFHQYGKHGRFDWHTHDKHFGVIYFIELDDARDATEFVHYGKFPVKEGDVLIFPTFLAHRSPLVSSERKTIISTNLEYRADESLCVLKSC